jgi:hypothetical protein
MEQQDDVVHGEGVEGVAGGGNAEASWMLAPRRIPRKASVEGGLVKPRSEEHTDDM